MQLQGVLINLDKFAQGNRYLRKDNAELDRHPIYPLPLVYNINGVVEMEARTLIDVFAPNDEDGVKELIPKKYKKSFEEVSELAAESFAKNEKWREENDHLDTNWGQRFEQQRQQREEEYQERKRKEKKGRRRETSRRYT